MNGKILPSGDHVSEPFDAFMKAHGMRQTYTQASAAYAGSMDDTDALAYPVATVLRRGERVYFGEVATSHLACRKVCAEYHVRQIALEPFEDGVLEYGTSDAPGCAVWTELPHCPTMPTHHMRRAFEELSASYSIFWKLVEGEFRIVADCA